LLQAAADCAAQRPMPVAIAKKRSVERGIVIFLGTVGQICRLGTKGNSFDSTDQKQQWYP